MNTVKPREAGFNGAHGIRIGIPGLHDGGIYKLRRGSTPPWKTNSDYRNQLVWQETTPPRLLYCNENNEWFELLFAAIQNE